jgi:hypothetical protein
MRWVYRRVRTWPVGKKHYLGYERRDYPITWTLPMAWPRWGKVAK